MKSIKLIIYSLVLGFSSSIPSLANNLAITGSTVTGSNITFNISWDNSWNTNFAPSNYDAVWVFVKYQDCATRVWNHASLSTTSADHQVASPLQVDAVSDGKGVFIRRSGFGAGNISSTSVTLKLNIPVGNYNYKVFGIEMVNVPQGDFEIGDGVSNSTFSNYTITATSQTTGITSTAIGGAAQAVPATFPMGYNSFYCMKYEITQEQYVEFLNTLTYDQQKNRIAVDPISVAGTNAMATSFGAYGTYRNGVKISVPGNNNTLPAVFACDLTSGTYNSTNDGQNIAMNYLSWADLSAYLDWSALRPMTELEFEKVCRGNMPRVASEYPWGSTAFVSLHSGNTNNSGTSTEAYSSSPASGLCISYVNVGTGYNSLSLHGGYGPVRVGLFATSTSGRESSGATFYGVMDMGGNVWEQLINVANTNGTSFTGVLGDGKLSIDGNHNQTNWPISSSGLGSGLKGSSWLSPSAYVSISNRTYIASPSIRNNENGGRGVR